MSDKLKGILIALALGDALGAPHEFKYTKHYKYTGTLEYPVKLFNRFQGESVFPVGSVTDDTQMTLTLAVQIIQDNKYIKDNVILAYEKWASTAKMLGKNTRALFKGVTTLKGYQNRYTKTFSVPQSEWTQSNGSLMRCTPFVIFESYDNLIEDIKLSNPHPVNIETGILYVFILKNLIQGYLPTIESLLQHIKEPAVIAVLHDVANKIDREIKGPFCSSTESKKDNDVKDIKGWVCTALYCSLYSIYHIPNLSDAYRYFIEKGGDTDTNAAILGALYGARDGYQKLRESESKNIDIILHCPFIGPESNPILKDIDTTVNQLMRISGITLNNS